jgi:hypothetical protein
MAGVVAVLIYFFAGCGYTLQNSHSELLEREGVHRVYVKPLVNSTFKPGVENIVYNALIRTLVSHGRVKLVQREIDADAVLQGNISAAQFTIAGSTSASQLNPLLDRPVMDLDLRNVSVASVYAASLGCEFSLNRRITVPGKKDNLWSSSFSRSKPFSAANQLDVPGTTSALINESEFDRALLEMATNMMDDVHEFMLAMF